MNSYTSSYCQSLRSLRDMELITLRNNSGLKIDLLPNGSLCAIHTEDCLVNQIIGVPPEGAPFRLWLRDDSGGVSLTGPADAGYFGKIDDQTAAWKGVWNHWAWTVHLLLAPDQHAWSWQVDVHNNSTGPRRVDFVIAQDLGLGRVGSVRSNEAYISHYIDHSIVHHKEWGPVLLARQNLAQTENRHPWLSLACLTGAAGFATDARDVFGITQRVKGVPEILLSKNLPSVRRQGESACAALQSRSEVVAADSGTRALFSATFMEHHLEVSSESDLVHVHIPVAIEVGNVMPENIIMQSIWDRPDLLHGEELDKSRWDQLYPDRINEEHEGGMLWSFFTKDGRHVVSSGKEAVVDRMHGHILYNSCHFLPDEHAIGTTVYAPGIFNAQIYHGNPNFARLLTVVRDPYQRARGCGQRVWVHTGDGWRLLGSPSAFEMGLSHAAWLYQIGNRLLEMTTSMDAGSSSVSLRCRVREGDPVRWKITHQLALDVNELDSSGLVEINAEQDRMLLEFDPESEAARRCPGLRFKLTCMPCHDVVRFGCDELIWLDGISRGAPYAVVETAESQDITVQITADGKTVNVAEKSAFRLPCANWKIAKGGSELMTLAGILPWYRHDAWIHLATPHGLEQYGGAAWGVRDVCQGPVEWLITEQRYDEIRVILKTVFSHQYEETGLWPQWFMLGGYSDVQQVHCHGDIMFWPLKALCDYASAANDPGILDMQVPYTSVRTFQKTGGVVPLSDHVDRVVENYRKLCIPGTSLIAYGEGDWDDTLQPVRPEMREGMVSSWTVELAYQVFSQLADLYRRSGRDRAAAVLGELAEQIRLDVIKYLMPDGIISGFSTIRNGEAEPLLHPRDRVSGIQYRLLPMTRGIISGLFDSRQALTHLDIIREHLRFPDGVRLMNRPVTYEGGISRLFQRAETAAYFGREVSLQYVHAHIRYAEAMTRVGDGDETWWALQVVNPLGLKARLPQAAPRQSNVYFSSSDADVKDRYEAMNVYDQLREGRLTVKSGWRLYSSGPGLFLHKVRGCLLGIREDYNLVVFDPVMPRHMYSCAVLMQHEGHDVAIQYEEGRMDAVIINGRPVNAIPLTGNPYRNSGVAVDRAEYRNILHPGNNSVKIIIKAPG